MDPIPAAFAKVARLRGRRRPVHTSGIALRGTLELAPDPRVARAVPELAPRTVEAVARLSRSFDVSRRIPDVLGLAVRVVDVGGPGRHLDVLLVSALPVPVVPVPAVTYDWPWWSTLLPYRLGGDTLGWVTGRSRTGGAAREGADPVAGARPAAAEDRLAYELGVTTVRGTHRIGLLRAGRELSPATTEELELDPSNDLPGLRQEAGWLARVRERSYAASRRARIT